MKIKILRAYLPNIDDYVYISDSKGKAEVAFSTWQAYKEALKCVNNFEREVNRQYDDLEHSK